MLYFNAWCSENEGDSRKLEKVQELVEHLCEQCRHYVPKQNVTYKHWWKFEINYEEKKRSKEKLQFAQIWSNLYKVWRKAEDLISKWWACVGRALSCPSLSCKSWSPIKNSLKSVLDLITEIALKRVRESIFFQSNKFTACKVRDRREVAKSLMVFNLPNMIHPF